MLYHRGESTITQSHTTMTHAELSQYITDRMTQKLQIHKMRPVQDVLRSDLVDICAAMEFVIRLYQDSGSYDAAKSLDARVILWDMMSDYCITDSEIEKHELFTK